jgi:hypothetical protein
MYKALQVSPMVPTQDLTVTRDFLVNVFGVVIQFESSEYCILRKDQELIHLCPAAGTPNPNSFYLEVKGIENLWESIRHKMEGLNFRKLFTQPYGMKEFHIVLPAAETLMFVGEAI